MYWDASCVNIHSDENTMSHSFVILLPFFNSPSMASSLFFGRIGLLPRLWYFAKPIRFKVLHKFHRPGYRPSFVISFPYGNTKWMGVPMGYGFYPMDRIQFPVALSLLWALSALLGFNKEENTTHKFPYKFPFIYKCIHPSWNYQNGVMERRTWKRFEYKYIFSRFASKKTNNTEYFYNTD